MCFRKYPFTELIVYLYIVILVFCISNFYSVINNLYSVILIIKRFGTSVKRVCSYPGASDHVLLVAVIKTKITNIKTHIEQRNIGYNRIESGDTSIRNKMVAESWRRMQV